MVKIQDIEIPSPIFHFIDHLLDQEIPRPPIFVLDRDVTSGQGNEDIIERNP